MADAPARLTWFSTLVAPDGARRILEVGCGNGQLLELLAVRCPRAELVGIDRSERQVRRAVMRLAALPRAPQVHHVALETAGEYFAPRRFSLVVAMNVNLVWTHPQRAGAALRELLARDGRVVLGYEPPSPQGRASLRARLLDAIPDTGFMLHAEYEPADTPSGVFAVELRLLATRAARAGRRGSSQAGRSGRAQKLQRSRVET